MRRVRNVQADEIRALKRMRDSEIDTTDIPPVTDWSRAIAGKFYRPVQKPFTNKFVVRISDYGDFAA